MGVKAIKLKDTNFIFYTMISPTRRFTLLCVYEKLRRKDPPHSSLGDPHLDRIGKRIGRVNLRKRMSMWWFEEAVSRLHNFGYNSNNDDIPGPKNIPTTLISGTDNYSSSIFVKRINTKPPSSYIWRKQIVWEHVLSGLLFSSPILT